MQFNFSKNGVFMYIENRKGTYNREGYIYFAKEKFEIEGYLQ